MKLLICSLFVMVAVVASKKQALLGADDLDKRVANALANNAQAPKTLREIKRLTKDDRVEFKRLQARARSLKHDLADRNTSKNKKKSLKKEFRDLKKNIHTKREEITKLKAIMKQKKKEKRIKKAKHNGGKKGSNNRKMMFIQAAEMKLKPTTEKPSTTSESLMKLVLNMQAKQKAQGKGNKKNKGKSRDFLNRPQGDAPAPTASPVLPHRGSGHKKIKCTADADCPGAAHCIANKKGHKHCKIRGGLKPAGKKCHSSHQCMRGLKCFVTKTPEQLSHKKHPRRGKGVCADPATTDTSKGKFLEFNHKL